MALVLKCLWLEANLVTTANHPTYGPATGKAAVISSISLASKSASAVTVGVGVRSAANAFAYLLPPATQVPPAGRLVITDNITLSAGDKVEVWAGASNALDLVISGAERDV